MATLSPFSTPTRRGIPSATSARNGTYADSVEELLAAYDVVRPVRSDRPWVLLNLIASFDGRATVFGRIGALSTAADQMLFHHLRGLSDAILVGASTVRTERYGPPRISPEVRSARARRGQTPEPMLCIVSRSLDLNGAAESLRATTIRPVVITCDAAPATRVVELAATMELMSAGNDDVDFARALAALRRRGVRVMVCEGGPSVNSELLRHGLVDEICVTYAPFLGGDDLTVLTGKAARLSQLNITHAQALDGSVFVRALIDTLRR